ncbi:MAG: DUF6516 family protein [Burkholderiaceae bacterium]|jgi:hypothetical protein
MFSNMDAVLQVRRRVIMAADAFAEIVVWRIPEPVPPSTHEFKYRLAYIVGGECVLRFDNERGKGDHRHLAGSEAKYVFSDVEKLLADFNADIEGWNREHGRS